MLAFQIEAIEKELRKVNVAVLEYNDGRWRLRILAGRQTFDVTGATFLDALAQGANVLALEDALPFGEDGPR